MVLRAKGVERKLDQKKEALESVLVILGGKDRMTDKLYRRFADRRTFTTEDLRELCRLFRRAVSESTTTVESEDGAIVFRRRLDGTYQRSE